LIVFQFLGNGNRTVICNLIFCSLAYTFRKFLVFFTDWAQGISLYLRIKKQQQNLDEEVIAYFKSTNSIIQTVSFYKNQTNKPLVEAKTTLKIY